MFRKLVDLLFKEEEIIIEEDEHEVEDISIQSIQPIVLKKEETLDMSVVSDAVEEEAPKKSFRIDVDDSFNQGVTLKTEVKKENTDNSTKLYRTKQVISPMHGGDFELNEPIHKPSIQSPKKRTPLTEVISPMFGKMGFEPEEAESFEEDLLDLDLKEMISDDSNSLDDEVQTTLFDYLEELGDK